MHETVKSDIEKILKEENEEVLGKMFLSSIDYLMSKEGENSRKIKSIVKSIGFTNNRNFLIQMAEYLSPVDVRDIELVIEIIRKNSEIPEIMKGDAIYGISKMYENRNKRVWASDKTRVIPEIAMVRTAQKSIEHYEKSYDVTQYRRVCQEVAKYKIENPGATHKQEAIELFKRIIGEISKDIVSKGKKLHRASPSPFDTYDLPEHELLRIFDDILGILETTLNNGVDDLVRQYSSSLRDLHTQNRQYYMGVGDNLPDDINDWEEQMRKLRQSRMINNYEAISLIPKDWQDKDRGQDRRRQTYHNQKVTENIVKSYTDIMDKSTEVMLIEMKKEKSGDELIEIYQESVANTVPENKYVRILKKSFTRQEYYVKISAILCDTSLEERIKLARESFQVRDVNDTVRVQQDRENRIELQLGIMLGIKHIDRIENEDNKKIKDLLEEMIVEGKDIGRYDIVLEVYRLLMNNQIKIDLDTSIKSFKKQNELNKIYGDRIAGLDVGLDYIEDNKLDLGDRTEEIISIVQEEYEMNVILKMYNTIHYDAKAEEQYSRIVSL
ncbi:MAG: hypothetical protein HeimC2_32500 [Candidatus Heimdallarchaeota archaeon LC_2]|nr:MAG: hypothetical protein HeimC2_32500 [Candidatus Heimdallarchaeota archaeon LC_2]